ncbi:Nucleoporin nup57 [Mycoemilia scoparia]|uniref:Nucleoporin nup57 n=1 Tax=Mycoemilia scoparia TaxID=417184 RepID=A0A9W8A4P0_9FUNG|nr:Nucleoporin nup57 [Mycoemilia scoparia]
MFGTGTSGGFGSNTGSGLFGSSKPTTGLSISTPGFGATNSTASAPGTSGLFGQNNNTNTATSSGGTNLFGNTTSTSNTGINNQFGNTATNASTTATGGLFGSSTNTNASTGGFGNTATSASGNLFGNTATTNAGANTGSLFGNTAAPSAGGNTGGSLFGNTSATSAGTNTGSLFGNTSTLNTGTNTGGLFGNTATSSGGTATNSLFGNTSTSVAGTGSGGLFGNTSAANTGGLGGNSLFGSTNTGAASTGAGLFGSSNTANASSGLGSFGQTQQQTQGMNPTQNQAGQKDQQEFEQICQQLVFIKECWDPASANCQFRHYFYNAVDPSEVSRYQCPPNQDPVLWQMAQRDNPDPTKLVPVLASSFIDLKERVGLQQKQSEAYKSALKMISEKLESLMRKHHNITLIKLSEARRRHADLAQRLLEFMKSLQLLRLRSQMLKPEEEMLRVRVEELTRALSSQQSLQQILSDTQSKLYRLQAYAQYRRTVGGWGDIGGTNDESSNPTDTQNQILEGQLEPVLNALADQQRATLFLTETTHEANEDMTRIEKEIERQGEEMGIAF